MDGVRGRNDLDTAPTAFGLAPADARRANTCAAARAESAEYLPNQR